MLAVNEPELLRLYYDFPEFHTRLHKEVLEKAGAALTVSQPEAAGGGPLEAQKEGAQGKLPPQAVPVVESAGSGAALIALNRPQMSVPFLLVTRWPRLIRWAIPFIWKILCFKSPA